MSVASIPPIQVENDDGDCEKPIPIDPTTLAPASVLLVPLEERACFTSSSTHCVHTTSLIRGRQYYHYQCRCTDRLIAIHDSVPHISVHPSQSPVCVSGNKEQLSTFLDTS